MARHGGALIVFPQQAMSADPQGTAGNSYGEYLVFLDVIVNSASIDIYDFRGAGHADDLYVFRTTWAPHFISKNNGRSYFSHGDALQSARFVLTWSNRFCTRSDSPSVFQRLSSLGNASYTPS